MKPFKGNKDSAEGSVHRVVTQMDQEETTIEVKADRRVGRITGS